MAPIPLSQVSTKPGDHSSEPSAPQSTPEKIHRPPLHSTGGQGNGQSKTIPSLLSRLKKQKAELAAKEEFIVKQEEEIAKKDIIIAQQQKYLAKVIVCQEEIADESTIFNSAMEFMKEDAEKILKKAKAKWKEEQAMKVLVSRKNDLITDLRREIKAGLKREGSLEDTIENLEVGINKLVELRSKEKEILEQNIGLPEKVEFLERRINEIMKSVWKRGRRKDTNSLEDRMDGLEGLEERGEELVEIWLERGIKRKRELKDVEDDEEEEKEEEKEEVEQMRGRSRKRVLWDRENGF